MTSTTTEHSAWTIAGANTAMTNTYASVKAALATLERDRSLEIFLQGSYANSTNIRADSDVDIVVMKKHVFRGSVDRLSPLARQRYDVLPNAGYSAQDLRSEVMAALNAYYDSARVHPRNKCIQVDKTAGYVDADVVPCIEYHLYTSPNPDLGRDYLQGIMIHPRSGSPIINFPKLHIQNGKDKNAACSENYKKTVRQMKHLRNRAVDEGLIPDDIAPGYLLECLTFNVPNSLFVENDSQRLLSVVSWLRLTDKSAFMSCDRVHTLFETDPGGFDVVSAQQIVDAMWEAY